MAISANTADAKAAPFTGLTAKVSIGDELLAYISGFNLDLSRDMIEVLQFGATYKEKVPAIADWTGSVDGTCAFVSGGTQEKLYQAFNNATKVTFGMYLSETCYFSGTGYVSKFSVDTTSDDKVNLSADVEGTGATTITIPASV